MGKPKGFLEYERTVSLAIPPDKRIQNYEEFHIPLTQEQQQLQGARCMDCGIPFCQSGLVIGGMVSGCPLNNLIPEWNDLICSEQWNHALRRLLLTNNFPEFTGRVCPAPCEHACTCSLNGDPVTIKENELAIIEKAFEDGLIHPIPPVTRTGKTVAVVGSGPAGLAAAAQLNRRGHTVTVFERDDRVGGLLMYGIPNMKLEKTVIKRRVDLLEQEGIIFKTGVNIGKDVTGNELLEQFDAVVLTVGASQPRDIKVPGRDANGIHFAVDFLRETTNSLLKSSSRDSLTISAKYKDVVVIGGGDTGNDCVGTSIRHGCRSVVQLEMMPKPSLTRQPNNSWPQWAKVLKTDYGQEEAIAVFGHDPRVFETTVKEFIKDEKNNLIGIKTVMVEFSPDKDGKMVLKEKEGSEKEIPAQLALIAAGFVGTESYVTETFGLSQDNRGNIPTNNFQTQNEKIFAAGDARRGQSLVVWAIREGRDVARAVDNYLMGYSNL